MDTKTEDKKGLDSFSEENMFNAEGAIEFPEAPEDLFDISDYDGIEFPKKEADATPPANDNENEEDLNLEDDLDNDDDFKFEEEEKEEGEIDLELFNKQFNTNFTKQQELKDFIESKEKKEEVVEEEKTIESADNYLSIVEPLLAVGQNGNYIVNDESLMRKQFETIALSEGKDLNDEDVQISINEQIEELVDNNTLKYEARDLRRTLVDTVNKTKSQKQSILDKREADRQAKEKEFKTALQKDYMALYGDGNFYGVDLNKEIVSKAYKKATNGEFEKSLKDKRVLAELSLIAELKEEIFKKATGLTYNDGIKSILDDYKSKKKDSPVIGAQKRGTIANNPNSQKGLIDSILYTKPKEKEKAD